MDELLNKVQAIKRDQEVLNKEKTTNFAFWSLWKYYAQNEPWWDEFIQSNNIPFSELKYPQKNDLSRITASREYGQKLWEQRKAILDGLEELRLELNETLVLLKKENVTFKIIALFYGATEGGVHKYMVSQGLIANG